MKSARAPFLAALFFAATGCAGGSSGPPVESLPNGPTLPALSGNNVLPVTVDGSTCGTNSGLYANEPCVAITVCTHGTSTCQTINNILVDTGSYGLRIFSSVLTSVTPTQIMTGSSQLAECALFGTGSDWGPVETLDVVLGGEPAVQVPIQVINSTFASSGTKLCGTPDTDPTSAGFNGILGVGLFSNDCPDCNTKANNNWYFACSGTTCTSTTVSISNQVTNPVALLSQDNNGVIVEMPTIPAGGAVSTNGYLVLGIGTQSNNAPSGVTMFPASSPQGNFSTSFNGSNPTSFIDSGSNGLFFSSPSSTTVPNCTSTGGAGWFCPPNPVNLSATNTGNGGSPSNSVSFQVQDFDTLLNSPNAVFNDIGGDGGGVFDWGLPFFFGRNVYVGIENTSSSLGKGPYWAY